MKTANKKLTYSQAFSRLRKLANGHACSADIVWWDYGKNADNKILKEYTLYITGHRQYSGSSWEEAFKKLNSALK